MDLNTWFPYDGILGGCDLLGPGVQTTDSGLSVDFEGQWAGFSLLSGYLLPNPYCVDKEPPQPPATVNRVSAMSFSPW